ncbi:Mono(2-hydroxyethyl) terephthalate hydrolase [Paraburkholderia aspalathi]|uniref:tannase/feruloyl esterase family alpha/beta hydrolase n=1 Tax=Paraburkholderia aspalathi TaxID=1324617 RepID=UPI001B1794B5|nr:tannase/feruloyl esterase family alpha/beta hydrolase [Paraburkholderia aspalathi]CAE6845751.1 Mono(2-hydroxyethyl) terephthalate hydrolase [Paraburkholderia aspalathi]
MKSWIECNARRLVVALAVGGCVLALSGCGSSDNVASPAPVDYAALCTKINGQQFNGITVTATSRIAAAGGNPGYCKVSATGAASTTLDIEVDLPDNWSKRLLQQGGGGFDGSIPTVEATSAQFPLIKPLVRGIAYTASNGGNRTGNPAGLLTNATAEKDYAYASTGITVHFAKAVIAAFYGSAPKYTYFSGASNGGREAYLAAQNQPGDYDGIIAGDETMNMGTQVTAMLNIATLAGSAAMPSSAQWTAAYSAAVAQCGNANGVILNPAACTFDPSTLQCGASGAPAATCLSAAQLQTVQRIVAPLSTSGGQLLFSGYNWADFGSMFGVGSYGGLGGGFAAIATGNANWLLPATVSGSLQANFNVDTSYPVIAAGLQNVGADHNLQAIAQYLMTGKKLISFNGAADPLISPRDHLRNWQTVVQLAGSAGGNARFYLEPGVGHVLGGNGPDQTDYLGAMIAWVEQGTAPGQLVLTKFDSNGNVTSSLPDCPYPTVPHYSGSGSVSAAASYTCAAS